MKKFQLSGFCPSAEGKRNDDRKEYFIFVHSVAVRSQRMNLRARQDTVANLCKIAFLAISMVRVHAPEPWMWRARARETQKFTENPLKSWNLRLLHKHCLRLLKRNRNKFQAVSFHFFLACTLNDFCCFVRCRGQTKRRFFFFGTKN